MPVVCGLGIDQRVNKEVSPDEQPVGPKENKPVGEAGNTEAKPESSAAQQPKHENGAPAEKAVTAGAVENQEQVKDGDLAEGSIAEGGEATAVSDQAHGGTGGAVPYIPIVMPQPKGESVLVKIFVLFLKLFAKMMPLMIVGVFAYYSYTSYFGPLPFVDKIWRKTAGFIGVEVAPPPAVEKKAVITQMMDKAKAVVASNNKSVDFANALAEDKLDMTNLTALADAAEGPSDLQAQIAKLVPPGTMEAAAGNAPPGDAAPPGAPGAPSIPGAMGAPGAKEVGAPTTAQIVAPQFTPAVKIELLEEMSLVQVPTEATPTQEFLSWVGKASIGGVMDGENPKANVNGINVDKGEVIEDELGISFEGLDATGSLVVFKDRHGARIGKIY